MPYGNIGRSSGRSARGCSRVDMLGPPTSGRMLESSHLGDSCMVPGRNQAPTCHVAPAYCTTCTSKVNEKQALTVKPWRRNGRQGRNGPADRLLLPSCPVAEVFKCPRTSRSSRVGHSSCGHAYPASAEQGENRGQG
eukprot:357001-Chlamydomonas_euryale.AAC.15